MMDAILRRRLMWFLAIAVIGCAADLATKSWVFRELGPPPLEHGIDNTRWLVGRYIGLQTSLNEGALFGMGQGKVAFFAALAILAAVGIPLWLFIFAAARDGWVNIALAFVMGGILGNLYDRLGLWWDASFIGYPKHAVRDWILFRYGDWTWPNFNLADSYLVTGAVMILIQAFLPQPQNLIDNVSEQTS